MTAIKAYFFDLDGTLTDAREGLYYCFRAALKALTLGDLPDERLARFLGPPLPEMFRVLKPEISEGEIAAGMAAFRAAYEAGGIKRNALYPDVSAMLQAIADKGALAWIVTSKPQHYAAQVASALGIAGYFKGITGAGLDERDTKAEMLAFALQRAQVSAGEAVMVGDRFYDVVGALENDIRPVGALWGYGSHEELHGAGCRLFAESAAEFRRRFVEREDFAPA
jgi:phosphoglycolate phosphatase